METPQKTLVQNGTPVSKLKLKNSPVFSYINSLSPIKHVKSILTVQSFGSLSPVFTSPHTPSHKGSRFKSNNTNSFGPSVELVEEALIETIPQQILKDDYCFSTPPRRAATIYDGSCGDGKTNLQKMCDDNVKRKSDTPDWETLFPKTPEMLTYDSLNDSEADRCFLPASSDSKRRPSSGTKSADTLHRGVRRRLLDFEKSSSQFVVPSTGLHLNTIVMSSKDSNVGNEHSLSENIKAVENTTKDAAGQSVVKEVLKSSLALVVMDQSSPKKKRLKSEQAENGESSCKRCHCKKSKCLKLYCECFAAGVYCIDSCSCVECLNKPIHEDTVLATRKKIESRNPLAFAPKVIKNIDSSMMQVGDDARKTPASARHKRGCNCRKSKCLKKYCDCYQSGVGCSINCRCEGCKNAFGRKDGSSFVGMDTKQDNESEIAKTQQKTELFSSVLLPPSTPMTLRQPLAQLPISSNNSLLPQKSQDLHGASGLSLYESQSFRKQGMGLLSHSGIKTVREERAEDIENVIPSPLTNINPVSPNSKSFFSASS